MEQLNRPQGLNLNIKPEELKDIVCEQCGGRYFRQVNSFKISLPNEDSRFSSLLIWLGPFEDWPTYNQNPNSEIHWWEDGENRDIS